MPTDAGLPNLRIVPRNFHDDATLSVQFAPAATFPAENTQNCIRSRVWKSASGTDQYLLGTFPDGLSRTVSFFGMFRHLCQGGNVRLQLFSDAAWSSPVWDTGALPVINISPSFGADWGINPYGLGTIDPFLLDAPYWIWIPPTPCLSYQITLSGNVSTFGTPYWQVCRFFLGNFFEVKYNPAYGMTLGYVDQTDRNRSRGASLRTNVGPIWRVMTMDLTLIQENERAAWLDIMRYCGTGRDLALSLFPLDGTRLERDHVINAKFTALDVLSRPVRVLSKKLQIEEV